MYWSFVYASKFFHRPPLQNPRIRQKLLKFLQGETTVCSVVGRSPMLNPRPAINKCPRELFWLRGKLSFHSIKILGVHFSTGTSVSRPRNFPPQLPAGGAFPLYYVDISPSGLRASVDMTASLRYERFE